MNFQKNLSKYFDEFKQVVSSDKNEWTVKGFIDIFKNIYTISADTKVVSKIIELMIFPILVKFANDNNYKMILTKHQNHYPDITFIDSEKNKFALDIKSSYRINDDKINGMTLGAFTGYFRNRSSNKNITFPYNQYTAHFVLGIIYTKTDLYKSKNDLTKIGLNVSSKKIIESMEKYLANPEEESIEKLEETLHRQIKGKKIDFNKIIDILDSNRIDERKIYCIDDLKSITSVVCNFDFFVQEKWKIAIDRPGSGNTKNIGSTTKIQELKNGTALFTKKENGKELFSDYWQNYLTKDMAKAIDMEKPPFNNLESYKKYVDSLKKGVK